MFIGSSAEVHKILYSPVWVIQPQYVTLAERFKSMSLKLVAAFALMWIFALGYTSEHLLYFDSTSDWFYTV